MARQLLRRAAMPPAPSADGSGWSGPTRTPGSRSSASCATPGRRPAGDLVDPTPQLFYRSFAQWDLPPTTVLARTSLDAAGLVGAMQRELRAVNVALPVISAKTMAQYLEDSLLGRIAATFLGGLGALGLCLAGIGLYAVVAFAVSRRSREIGIRMALGARSQQVVWTVAREVAVLVGVGTGVGLALSLMAILALRLVTYRRRASRCTARRDPVALLSIAAFMAMVGLAAAYVPARRAARMDPLAALRRDRCVPSASPCHADQRRSIVTSNDSACSTAPTS